MEQHEDIAGRELSLEDSRQEDMRHPLEVQNPGKQHHSSSEEQTPRKRHRSASEDQTLGKRHRSASEDHTPGKRHRSSSEKEEGVNHQPTTSERERLLEAAKEDLREKIMRLSLLCRVCREEDANIFFFPCAHLVTCGYCCFIPKCPACASEVEDRLRTYRS